MNQIKILDVKIDRLSQEEALDQANKMLVSAKKSMIVTPNPEMLVLAQEDKDFKNILNSADLSIADGIGLIWAAKILGKNLKKRIAGTDFMFQLCQNIALEGNTVYLLGAKEGIAEKTSQILKNKFPGLKVLGFYSGNPDSCNDQATRKIIQEQIQGQEIDYLFVAYGHGKQEKWIQRNLDKIPVKIAMGVGGAFDYISGETPRAPKWMQNLGLEWFYRLIRQPWRLKRQLNLLRFIFYVLKAKFC